MRTTLIFATTTAVLLASALPVSAYAFEPAPQSFVADFGQPIPPQADMVAEVCVAQGVDMALITTDPMRFDTGLEDIPQTQMLCLDAGD